ncbi:hypothetical protein HYX08_06985 [Candidatus Woesearchaeota archaeon]|nr:hypothetical protein [Candidatus Woesearchaeota archaeon]
MRDLVLFAHIILGLSLIAFPIIILLYIKKRPNWLKHISFITAAASWLLLLPSGKLYLTFYPATKTLVNAGAWPWAHSIVMETKEHWGLLIPIAATVAAGLIFTGKHEESRKWWILVIAVSALLGVMGRVVKIGALA